MCDKIINPSVREFENGQGWILLILIFFKKMQIKFSEIQSKNETMKMKIFRYDFPTR